MAEQTNVDSIQAGIEPTVAVNQQPEATPRLAPRETAEISENAVFPSDSSELTALMDVIEEELAKIEQTQTTIIEPLEPIISADGEVIDFENLEAAAAGGGAGGAGGDGSSFVRLGRVSESINPLEYDYEPPVLGSPQEIEGASTEEEPVVLIDEPTPEDPPVDDPDPEDPPTTEEPTETEDPGTPPQTSTGSNPGNDKPVGNSPWDGETGASGKPGNGNHHDGIDTDENQPGGNEKGQNLNPADLLDDGESSLIPQSNDDMGLTTFLLTQSSQLLSE
jgi:hypothetical protein